MKYGVAIFLPYIFLANPLFAQTDTLSNKSSELEGNSVGFHFNVGGSLIRNTITPTFNFNLHMFLASKYQIQLGTTSHYFFEKDGNQKFSMYPNTFITAKWLFTNKLKKGVDRFDKSIWRGVGLSYIVDNFGNYYTENTVKIFYVYGLTNSIQVSMELILTDDFKTLFPGITITSGF